MTSGVKSTMYIRVEILVTLVKNLYYPDKKKDIFFRIDCENCNSYLTDTSQATTSLLIDRHDRGGLVKPHKDVVEVVKIGNSIFERKKNMSDDVLSDHVTTKVVNQRSFTYFQQQTKSPH